MSSETRSYKIAAYFIIFFVSLLGAYLPFAYLKCVNDKNVVGTEIKSSELFSQLKSLSCGVIIGVALMHLLPDAEGDIGNLSADYPFHFLFAGIGIILCLVCSQISLWIASEENSLNTAPEINKSISLSKPFILDHIEHYDYLNHTDSCPNGITSSVQSTQHVTQNSCEDSCCSLPPNHLNNPQSHAHSNCEQDLVVSIFAKSGDDPRILLKAYILEVAIAIHSVILGVSFGGEKKLNTIKVLIVAYSIHQFLEGLSLGCAIAATKLTYLPIVGLVAFFALTVPIGIAIGMGVERSQDEETSGIVEGVMNSIAGGILLYVSLVELMAEEFNAENVRKNFALKVKMTTLLSLGFSLMSVLAIYA